MEQAEVFEIKNKPSTRSLNVNVKHISLSIVYLVFGFSYVNNVLVYKCH